MKRTRRRAGNRKAAVLALLVVALKASPAQSQTLSELGALWWNEGGIKNSMALAEAIVEAAKSVPGGIATTASDLAKQLNELTPSEKEEVHDALTPPVVTTELPSLSPIEKPSMLRESETYAFTRKDDGSTQRVFIFENTGRGPIVTDPPIDMNAWSSYIVTGPLPPMPDEDDFEGGKRRKPRRKTLRRKRQWTRRRHALR